MSDVVVTVPQRFWRKWIAEGCLPGERIPKGVESYWFSIGQRRPKIEPGERVYIVAHNMLRGYAPLVYMDWDFGEGCVLARGAGAVAVTITELIRGFQGYRYRWWSREDEVPFPDWQKEQP